MKDIEIDYKKLYEEALERAKYWADGKCMEGFYDSPQNVLGFVFPEAKESEDEKMLREIKTYIKEQGDKPEGLPNGSVAVADMLTWLEKQGEQKPTDTPKFKVGDWVVWNNHINCHIDNIYQGKKTLMYAINTNGVLWSNSVKDFDAKAHLWTIEDAKDGDVLVASDGSIFLFKSVIDCGCKHYIGLTTDNKVQFNEGLEHYWETSTAVHPAAKEQRDLLFQKMNEAGYEWDAEKKELKKIEQKSAWSDEDEVMLGNALWACKEKYCSIETYNWLKSLKDRITPTNKNDFDRGYDVGISAAKFNQWRPTEEQMEALSDAVKLYKSTHFDSHHYKIETLYEDLKKL